MKICKACACEHQDRAEKCTECGGVLIDASEQVLDQEVVYQDLKKLTHCNSNEEANLLISLLNDAGLFGTITYEDTGSYLNIVHGRNFQGADVMVPSEDYEAASRVLAVFQYDPTNHSVEGELEAELIKYNKRKRLIGFVFIFAMFGGAFIALTMSMISNILY